MEKKKNDTPYIIPPSYFKNKGITPIPISKPVSEAPKTAPIATAKAPVVEKEIQTTASNSSFDLEKAENKINTQHQTATDHSTLTTPSKDTQQPSTIAKPAVLGNAVRKSSGLSLNSIRKKKIHEAQKTDKVLDPENLPSDTFTEAQLQTAWKEYGKRQDKKGERILGSMLAMNIPTLQEGDIHLELPNGSMKVDMETAQAALLQYLNQKLNNYALKMVITVNESVAKKHAFTPQDKYEKLREKNPLIDKLRATFDLDI